MRGSSLASTNARTLLTRGLSSAQRESSSQERKWIIIRRAPACTKESSASQFCYETPRHAQTNSVTSYSLRWQPIHFLRSYMNLQAMVERNLEIYRIPQRANSILSQRKPTLKTLIGFPWWSFLWVHPRSNSKLHKVPSLFFLRSSTQGANSSQWSSSEKLHKVPSFSFASISVMKPLGMQKRIPWPATP